MLFWNRKKHKEKDGIIQKLKEMEQKYRVELEQKNKLILQYIEKESEYLRDQHNDKQSIQELQQKVANYEQKEKEAKEELINKEKVINELNQKMKRYEQQLNVEDPKQLIKELQQKILEYEQRETMYKTKLTTLETNLRSLPRKQPMVTQTEGHFKKMDRISKKLSNEQNSSMSKHKSQTSFQTRTPQKSQNYYSNQNPSHMVQFNPFKRNQGS